MKNDQWVCIVQRPQYRFRILNTQHKVRGCSCFETFVVQTDNARRIGEERREQRRKTVGHINIESQPGAEPRLSTAHRILTLVSLGPISKGKELCCLMQIAFYIRSVCKINMQDLV